MSLRIPVDGMPLIEAIMPRYLGQNKVTFNVMIFNHANKIEVVKNMATNPAAWMQN